MIRWIKSLFAADPKVVGARRPRSSRWWKKRMNWLKVHPTCEACGGKDNLEVHHILPFSYYPEFELEDFNLQTLCEHPARNCHLNTGHSGNYTGYNPHCVEDAALTLKRRKERKHER